MKKTSKKNNTVAINKDEQPFPINMARITADNYFYLMVPNEMPIEEEIEYYKGVGEIKNVAKLEAASKLGRKTTTLFRAEKMTPEKFDIFYKAKLNEYLQKTEFSLEKDFIENEIKKIRSWFDKVPEKKILNRWLEYLDAKLYMVPIKEKTPKKIKDPSKDFSLKQIAIAYFFLKIQITDENAETILKEWSYFASSKKLLAKRVSKASDLTKTSGNRTTDTKHLKDLKAAKRLISLAKKNEEALTSINRIITTFENSYQNS